MSLNGDFEALDAAFESGVLAGKSRGSDPLGCPFNKKNEPTFREAWLNGYLIGSVQAGIDRTPVASDVVLHPEADRLRALARDCRNHAACASTEEGRNELLKMASEYEIRLAEILRSCAGRRR